MTSLSKIKLLTIYYQINNNWVIKKKRRITNMYQLNRIRDYILKRYNINIYYRYRDL